MKPQPMKRSGDCLATAVAAMLDLDASELPHTGAVPWEDAYRKFRLALAERGWRIAFYDYDYDDYTLADVLRRDREDADEVDSQLTWIVSVGHPSFHGESHVIVCRGGQVVFDPGGDVDQRPPLNELVYGGAFMLSPLDPSRFALRDAA